MHVASSQEPVRVALGRSGNTVYTVERVAQAADILLDRWPTKTGRMHIAAQRACLGALEGLKEARFARGSAHQCRDRGRYSG
ncbi:DUF982 domain-containing protein [Mesorhizobium sp.]|uniref:DUF982 domain-containing protein n=1 Tax=Mesorhizobium sp. TaxID=1871066 RepID=UPI00258083FA|nr:DUF982 domain-containing protein [Mesorhizobium sp.]